MDTKIDFFQPPNNYNILDDLESGISGDLANVLDNEKINESRGTSEKLKDFFKKLIQTDAQIRRLKQAVKNYGINDKTFVDRYKRSLKNKRFANNVTGFLIRKEKILIQYDTDKKRNFPKCSHHKMNSHEHQLAKADDNKILLSETKKKKTTTRAHKKTTKHATVDYNHYDNDIMFNKLETKTETPIDNFVTEIDYAMNNLLSTSPSYDFTLSVSTFMNPIFGKESNNTSTQTHQHPAYRKLLQVDEEKEELIYEDLKEVLTDDQQNDRDDIERHLDRIKRDNDQDAPNFDENNPSNIYNPNWKGPMPLYPDELNAMIKQAALQNLNIQVPVNTKDIKAEKDKDEREVSDTEYVEDYVDNKYNKMVKMAQAYSDYGVVYGKNGNNNEENIKNTEQDQKYKLFFDKGNLLNRFFRRPGKASAYNPGEGFKFEIKPGPAPKEDSELLKGIDKHVKFCKSKQAVPHITDEYEKMYTPSHLMSSSDTIGDTTLKHIVFTFNKGSRSLKSVKIDEYPEDVTNNTSKDFKLNYLTNGILDFISAMSDWFSTIAGLSGEKGLFLNKNYTGYNATDTKANNKNIENGDVLYPTYDFDMVDNIGHRSRVLMSVEDNSTYFKNNKTHNGTSKEKEIIKSSDFVHIVPITLVLATHDKANASKENNTNDKENDKIKNKTIVKRNLDKVFWNDMYDDDEYGVKVDYLDGVRNKHSVDKNVIQKSKKWIQNKFSNITRKIKDKVGRKKKKEKCTTMTSNLTKRSIRQANDNEDNEIKRSFAALTANMKKVFKKATQELQNTRNIDIRAENKEEAAATSLMQQLVRLMSDLVDIQVQQKTCAKLPADLHSFLEWLTVPVDNVRLEVDNLDTNPNPGISDNIDDSLGRFAKSTDPTLDLPTYTEDTHQDDRTECLGIIRSVQDLIQRYEEMTDEDKSKMTGVKEYLQNQLEFLNRKLDGLTDSNLYKMYGKRQVPRQRRDLWKNHRNNKINKFIKTFGKKHTRSTVISYDGVSVTKNKMRDENKLKVNVKKSVNKDVKN